jgi:Zn-dependent protease with chaperone function
MPGVDVRAQEVTQPPAGASPAGSVAASPASRRRSTAGRAPAALAVGLVLGLRVTGVLTVVALGAAAVDGLRAGGSLALAPALLGLALIARVVVAIGRDRPPGLRLTPGEQPALAALVTQTARRMGTAVPDELWITPEVDAFATVRRAVPPLGRRRRVAGLGLGLLAVVNVEQAQAVIAHELAHLDAARTRPLGWLRTAQAHLSVAAACLGRLGGAPFVRLSALLHRLAGPAFRQEEFDADEAAVAVCGAGPVSAALARIEQASRLYDRYAAHYVEPLWGRGLTPTHLVRGFQALRAWAPDLPAGPADDDLDAVDTHPPVAVRIARAQRLDPGAGGSPWPGDSAPDAPAWSLLEDPERLDRRVSQAYTDWAVSGGTEVSWERLTPAWFVDVARAGTAALYAAAAGLTTPPGSALAGVDADRSKLGPVLDLLELGRHDDLVRAMAAGPGADPALVAELRSCAPRQLPGLVHDVLAAHLGRAVSAELVDRAGFTWASLWSGPSVLRGADGGILALRDLVFAAAGTAAGATVLRWRLADAGLNT